MAKYHINRKDGNVGLCRAENGKCPFGGEDQHYESMMYAASVFEREMDTETFTPIPTKRDKEIYSALMEGDAAFHSGQSIASNPYGLGSEQREAWYDAFNNPSELDENEIRENEEAEERLEEEKIRSQELDSLRLREGGMWESHINPASETFEYSVRVAAIPNDIETTTLAQEGPLRIVDTNGESFILDSPEHGYVLVKMKDVENVFRQPFIPEDTAPPF